MIKSLFLLKSDGLKVSLSFNLRTKENGEIKISWEYEGKSRDVSSEDYFDGLVQVREILNREGFTVLCNGARIDVYPSRMSRQMSKGIKAYILTPGKPTSNNDLVDVFDIADYKKIGTVKQQQQYYEGWLKSLV